MKYSFHTSVNWWFHTGLCITTSPLNPPGLFSVFWPILIMLLLGWSLLVLLFSSLSAPLPILWGLSKMHQEQLVSLLPSCSVVIFSSLAMSWYFFLFLLSFIFTLWCGRAAKSTIRQVLLSFFCWLSLGLVFCLD